MLLAILPQQRLILVTALLQRSVPVRLQLQHIQRTTTQVDQLLQRLARHTVQPLRFLLAGLLQLRTPRITTPVEPQLQRITQPEQQQPRTTQHVQQLQHIILHVLPPQLSLQRSIRPRHLPQHLLQVVVQQQRLTLFVLHRSTHRNKLHGNV